MFRKKSTIWAAVLLGVVSLGLACDGQVDEANKLVNEGNAIITKNNELVAKSGALMTELLGDNFVKAEDTEKYIADNKAKLDELAKMSEETEKGWNDAAAKFEQASKMKVEEKFKEYLNLSAQEFKKRAEMEKADNTFLKALLAEKDPEKINALVNDSNKKTADLKKEADGLKAKSEQILKDNPTIFQKN
jgi:hypothetical protein